MSDTERTPGSPSPAPGTPTVEYEGPGAWGPAAMWLLGALFVLSAAATVHSILATFGG